MTATATFQSKEKTASIVVSFSLGGVGKKGGPSTCKIKDGYYTDVSLVFAVCECSSVGRV
ncbi:MAG: hypothetical protein LBP39_03080 [Rickettsiales bacterium]|nr:hypothetical protein [Rickettsiales bacterium]